uniref:Putative secreted protein fat body overexpressed n=1 Tax=Rhipicephalus microplus TaxID=6941 RepID=A0A6M2DEL9_RHIMP
MRTQPFHMLLLRCMLNLYILDPLQMSAHAQFLHCYQNLTLPQPLSQVPSTTQDPETTTTILEHNYLSSTPPKLVPIT